MASQIEWKSEPIAIIGIGCRFPGGANSPSKLWDLLKHPPDLLSKIPPTKFNVDGFYHPDGTHHGTTNVTDSYLLSEDPGLFDHEFFSIHPKEAECMDPQQRILLETVYEGLESAGYSMSKLRGSSTGVFVGQMTSDYYDIVNHDVASAPQYTPTGVSRAIAANRVSYFFDWKGPSVGIDTACSSSLVALHQATIALRNRECQVAIAGGVNIILGPENYIYESQLGMLSPTGRSRMWDASADGYARGEGFAAIILKPLTKALEDGDHIECIIRETGVNQDGRSDGLTVPNAAAQTALIEATYKRCGLDWRKREHRPQYFEAHGTGTLAGDPKEAQAIRDAFFPTGEDHSTGTDNILYVGSIKTVIGHTEGTAGLAGLIKACLAMQHKQIPPNLHFDELNPSIKPFYQHLRVPTELRAWPTLPPGVPRRASINSFGFGGTNAHAIIESWDVGSSQKSSDVAETEAVAAGLDRPHGPVVLSARSESALKGAASALSLALKSKTILNLRDMASTLQFRRHQFQFRTSLSASSRSQLTEKLEVATRNGLQISKATNISTTHPARILGIFTGQGAQWPRMGAELYENCGIFRQSICALQESLDVLPDRPSWTLVEELLAPAETSRLNLAEIAQPLSTAVQVALVDLLKILGISFSGVVGHSSGEIAAAYAAGYLSSADAIRIAYYRGVHTHLAQSPEGLRGVMMAVGMSPEKAESFCHDPRFLGRIGVAACNSTSSVTVSGDEDAINEAKNSLDEEKVFARKLLVDKAYHSHHMNPCSKPYLASLRACKIQLQRTSSEGDCIWYSSVYGRNGRRINDLDAFRDTYWVDNMVKPVLFLQSLDRAVHEGQRFDLALEIGPHPALKGPTSDTLKTLTGVDIPYSGTLKRNTNDMDAFADSLGFIWSNIDSPTPIPDFRAFSEACDASYQPQVCKGLPTYSWDHDKSLFRESRASKKWRTQPRPNHELLGTPVTYGDNQEVRWRKIMRVGEMEWLRGHRFQGQVLFPAAGYVTMAIEAARFIIEDQPVKLIELNDMKIHRAITLPEQSAGTEVTFVIRITNQSSTAIGAEYSCYSGNVDATLNDREQLNFVGCATIFLGLPSDDELPARNEEDLPLTQIDTDDFYEWISKIELDYSGDFLVDSIKRRLGSSTVTMKRVAGKGFRIHPATIDASFHGVFAAFSFPGDERMWTAYLPASIHRVRVPMGRSYVGQNWEDAGFVGDCYLHEATEKLIRGDVDIFRADDNHPEIQIEGLVCSSFKLPSPDEDRKLFARTVWRKDISCGVETNISLKTDLDENRLYEILERTCYFYLRKLRREISDEEIPSMEWHFQLSLGWAFDRLLPQILAGKHPWMRAEWSTDTEESISAWEDKYSDDINFQFLSAVGRSYPSIARGDIPALQVLRGGDMLDRFYKEVLGMKKALRVLGDCVAQLSHRYPKIKVLEIGAGTGGTTATVLDNLPSNIESYTFTDISAGFVEKASATFSQQSDKMVYKVLNIEHCPLEQGFEEHSYDIIVASNVLHATRSLKESVENCRKLVRPGGYLLLLEITNDFVWYKFIFSTLPGWWLGHEEGRIDNPSVSTEEWNSLLLNSGFSGVDNCLGGDPNESKSGLSIITSQAIDPVVSILRNPLAATHDSVQTENIIIIGGRKTQWRNETLETLRFLRPFASNTLVVDGLEDTNLVVPLGSAVVCLADLEEAAFKNMTPRKFAALQLVFNNSTRIVWATRGRRADDPYANITVGLGRSVMQESPHIRMQFVDIDSSLEASAPASVIVSQALLRMLCQDLPAAGNVLWSNESEIVIQGSDTYIPRVLPDSLLNDRANSGRRIVKALVSPTTCPVMLTRDSGGTLMLEKAQVSPKQISPDLMKVSAEFSSISEFLASDKKKFFLSIGRVLGSKEQKVLALTPSNYSISEVPSSHVFVCGRAESDEVVLSDALTALVCQSLVTGIEGTLWLHNADEHVVDFARDIAARCEIDLFLSSSTIRDGMTLIHPRTTERDLVARIPQNVQRLVIFGHAQDSRLGQSLESTFVEKIGIQNVTRLTHDTSIIPLSFNSTKAVDVLRQVVSSPTRAKTSTLPTVIEANEISTITSIPKISSLVKWQSAENIPVRTKQLSFSGLFSDRKTYFLIGLTGDVGISLCEWMVSNGARYLVITSRNPNIDPRTIRSLERKGAHVKVFPLDISDREALHRVYQQITTHMPPIAGIANAAMVLRDKPFSSMVLEDFNVVLGPKVRGSENLDKLFYSTDLDFFIMFSSMSRVVGNAGQSNYAAANMFMVSLAAKRRKRGVAASVIDIARFKGFGYVWRRQQPGMESHVAKNGYMALSEPDFHSIFAEAIESGRPNSSSSPTMHTGLAVLSDAFWRRVPRLSHYVKPENRKSKAENHKETAVNVQKQLANVPNEQEALSVLAFEFSKKLGIMLQIPSDKISGDTPLVSLGIDSLVAVEIRSWFLKELLVDIPVLSILGGATVTDLCFEARSKTQEPSSLPSDKEETDNGAGSSLSEGDTSPPSTRPSLTASPPVFGKMPGAEALSLASSETSVNEDHVLVTDSNLISKPEIFDRVGSVSHSQEALYFLHEYSEDKSSQNVTTIGKLHGQFDERKFENALYTVAKRHEALRSSYFIDKSTHRPVQAVHTEPKISFIRKHIRGQTEVSNEIANARKQVFDIEHGDLMQIIVLSESMTLHHLIFTHHHIILDTTAWYFFFSELNRAYSRKPFETPARQAIDISEKKRLANTSEKLEVELAFWGQVHQTPVEPLPLFPFSNTNSREPLKAYDTETFDITLDEELSSLIRQRASDIHITPFHFYLTTLAAFLSSCLHIDALNIGIVDANRHDEDDAMALGSYMNLLPLHFQMDRDETFEGAARRTRSTVISALANSHVPFEAILDRLKIHRSTTSHPLFQVLANYRLGSSNETPLDAGKVEWVRGIPPKNLYDLDLDIITSPRGPTIISFTTQRYLYGDSDTKLLLKWYTRALESFAHDPSINVGKCPISNGEDIKEAALLGKGPDMKIEWEGTIIHQVERTAAEHSSSLAIKDDDGQILTYAEMMERVHQISLGLKAESIPSGSNVAMLLNPSVDAICCLIAVLRSGFVWVPLDLRNSAQRLSAIVSDCNAPLVICSRETKDLAARLVDSPTRTLCVEDTVTLSSSKPITDASSPDQIAIIFYTSGSTGIPKGVKISHLGILNQIFVNTRLFNVGREVVLQQTSYGFDIVLDQIFQALANGGTLIVVGQKGRGDPVHISQLMLKESITYTHIVPSEYQLLFQYGIGFLKQCRSWRLAIAAGEKVTQHLRRAFRQLGLPNVQLVNAYGPTECTITCARGAVPYLTEEDVMSKSDGLWPLPNYSLSILNEDMSTAPIGFPGEICVSGVGVAQGYTNNPKETDRSFLDSHAVFGEKQASKLYRTGDKGRILEDGSITVLGRIEGDSQVKIHGIRVELDEITNAIIKASDGAVINAVASWRASQEILAAFVVFRPGFNGDIPGFLEQLKRSLPLPSYMCPSFIISTEHIPVNASGKRDRSAIDSWEINDAQPDRTPHPLTKTQERVLNIWKEVLGERVSAFSSIDESTDFFHVGGNSILLIKLRILLRSKFERKVSLPELFQSSSLGFMAELVDPTHQDLVSHNIDWDSELTTLCDGLPEPRTDTSKHDTSSLIVVLTGATGFLGKNVLRHLVGDEKIKQIHCVAIRPDSLQRPREAPIKHEKVFSYTGNLEDQQLGLSNSQFQELGDKVHVIIHIGAQVSFLQTYQSMRRANVLSTRALCRLAIPRRIPIHFVSTASVAFVAANYDPLPEISVSQYVPLPTPNSGYRDSKWASENFLERVQAVSSLPVWIHRPTSIIGDGTPEFDIVTSILRHSRLLGAVPLMGSPGIEGHFDLVSVEDVSRDLAQTALESIGSNHTTTTHFVHHCDGIKVQPEKLQDFLESTDGRKYQVMELRKWLDTAVKNGLSRVIYEYLIEVIGNGEKIAMPNLSKSNLEMA
ncbi:beta-ketoacyl synthase domain-containing protein [Daldinia bambusicola]|nr:beta-ketoacyl synthase domain-containing protein [Daldinia bambusicola]